MISFFGGIAGIAFAATAFDWPSAGVVTSEFGYRDGRLHSGIDMDITVAGTTPIKASAAGRVLTAYAGCPNTPSYSCGGQLGNHIILRHTVNGKTYDTVYAHLQSNLTVSVNQTVSQGQQLGWMGNSGNSTSQHLHFEIHPGGRIDQSTARNPRDYIGKIDVQPTYHTYDGTWAIVEITNPNGGSTANLFGNVGYGIIGTLDVGGAYKVYGKREYAENGDLYYNVGPGYIHHAYGILKNHHAVVSGTINTYNSPNGTFNRTLAAGTYKVHAAQDGWYNLGGTTWVNANQIKVIKNP